MVLNSSFSNTLGFSVTSVAQSIAGALKSPISVHHLTPNNVCATSARKELSSVVVAFGLLYMHTTFMVTRTWMLHSTTWMLGVELMLKQRVWGMCSRMSKALPPPVLPTLSSLIISYPWNGIWSSGPVQVSPKPRMSAFSS